jgi:hypothetical protein
MCPSYILRPPGGLLLVCSSAFAEAILENEAVIEKKEIQLLELKETLKLIAAHNV